MASLEIMELRRQGEPQFIAVGLEEMEDPAQVMALMAAVLAAAVVEPELPVLRVDLAAEGP